MHALVGLVEILWKQPTARRRLAMEIVATDIEHGNRQVLQQLMQSKGRA
jgi:hypothetical protein